MPSLKAIGTFCLVALLAYMLLTVRWPGVPEAYRDLFLSTMRGLFETFGDKGLVNFDALADDVGNDAVITMGKRGVELGQGVAISSWMVGYVPTAELVALVLATPISWSRKWRALCWGLILVNLFVLFRFWLVLLFAYSQNVPYRQYVPGPFWAKVLAGSHEFFFVAPTCSFLVPVLIWIVVALRSEDVIGISRGSRARRCD